MDAYDCIRTKLDLREFSADPVPNEVVLKVLEAARLTGSGVNSQHWRFIVVRGRDRLAKLAQDSTTGNWVEGASFAVIVLTDPKLSYHKLDAGRALQDMQLAAWNFGVASRLYTGVRADGMVKDFGVPLRMETTVVVGFGYPRRRVLGRKSRIALRDLAFEDRYGEPLKVEA